MANFNFDVTPTKRGEGTEGGLDTAINASGNSLQRTGFFEVVNGTNRKFVAVADGGTFNDTVTTTVAITGTGVTAA